MNPNSQNGGAKAPESFGAPQESYQSYESGTSNEREPQVETKAAAPEAAHLLAQPTMPLPTAAPVAMPPTDDADDEGSNLLGAKPGAESDRIEKQWIERAKSIIGQTAEDPHTQKNEMSKVKAQYIKKRFNKTLKVDSEAL